MKKIFKYIWKSIEIVACLAIFDLVLQGLSSFKFYVSLYEYPILWYIGYGLNVFVAFLIAKAVYFHYYFRKNN